MQNTRINFSVYNSDSSGHDGQWRSASGLREDGDRWTSSFYRAHLDSNEMEYIDTDTATEFFDVVGETERSKAATMILEAGQSTGGPSNRHPTSDQWLYVKSGRGTAIVDGEPCDLRAGVLVLFEAGDAHEIRNEGEEPLETINVYAPPDY